MSLIDKESLVTVFNRGFDRGLINTYGDVFDIINNAKIVDPVKHGKWNDKVFVGPAGFEYPDGWTCSECGTGSKEYRWNYCPYCGAKMDLSDE